MTIDPATSSDKKSDESAISVCGQDPETGYIFLLDEWAHRVQPHALIDQIIRMAKRWNPHKVGPEEVSFQKVLRTFLLEAMAREGVSWHIDPVKPHGRSKLTRIDALQPYVKNHQLYVRREHFKLIEELCGLQVVRGELLGKSPNRADALAYHVNFWRPRVFKGREPKPEIPLWDGSRSRRREIPAYGLEVAV